MIIIRETLNDNNLGEDLHYHLTLEEIAKFKYAKITSCDVEHNFSK